MVFEHFGHFACPHGGSGAIPSKLPITGYFLCLVLLNYILQFFLDKLKVAGTEPQSCVVCAVAAMLISSVFL